MPLSRPASVGRPCRCQKLLPDGHRRCTPLRNDPARVSRQSPRRACGARDGCGRFPPSSATRPRWPAPPGHAQIRAAWPRSNWRAHPGAVPPARLRSRLCASPSPARAPRPSCADAPPPRQPLRAGPRRTRAGPLPRWIEPAAVRPHLPPWPLRGLPDAQRAVGRSLQQLRKPRPRPEALSGPGPAPRGWTHRPASSRTRTRPASCLGYSPPRTWFPQRRCGHESGGLGGRLPRPLRGGAPPLPRASPPKPPTSAPQPRPSSQTRTPPRRRAPRRWHAAWQARRHTSSAPPPAGLLVGESKPLHLPARCGAPRVASEFHPGTRRRRCCHSRRPWLPCAASAPLRGRCDAVGEPRLPSPVRRDPRSVSRVPRRRHRCRANRRQVPGRRAVRSCRARGPARTPRCSHRCRLCAWSRMGAELAAATWTTYCEERPRCRPWAGPSV
mmetsp:Transcript_71134/g.203917  ORF Transcript_71134/g.203917 Transcript_71134/m.203917 type:complete len:442 (-) Transcript_71134:590-1915(-)